MRSWSVRATLATVVLVGLVACTGGRSDEADGPCDGDPPLCYPGDVVVDWCHVEYVRGQVEQGRLTASDLPSWVDLSRRKDGAPQIYDFTTTDTNNWARWSDDLRNSVRAAGKTWDPDAIDACRGDHDVKDVIRSEGVPRT